MDYNIVHSHNECKLRQSSEMVQYPEVVIVYVWFLTLLSEAHIWDMVILVRQVGGANGGDDDNDR